MTLMSTTPDFMTSQRVRRLLPTLLFATFGLGAAAHAQRLQPVGVSIHRDSVATSIASSRLTEAEGRWHQRGFWAWTGIGLVAGGAIGATWAAIEVSNSDDPMLVNLGIAISTGAGAIAGGLLGALTYTLSHLPAKKDG